MVRNSPKEKCAPVRVILRGLKPLDTNFLLGNPQSCFSAPADLSRAGAKSDDSVIPQQSTPTSQQRLAYQFDLSIRCALDAIGKG